MVPPVDNLMVMGDDVDEELLRGWLVFYSMPDDPVPADKLIAAAAKHGLDDKMLPDVRQPVHVFQSACASVAARVGNGNGRVEVRVDEVENNPGRCSYQITRVVWNLDDRVIEHEKALRLEFDKRTQGVRSERLDHFDPALNDLEDRVRDHYEANMSTIPGSKVRNMVRDVIRRMYGINMRRRGGGVYFVPKELPGANELKLGGKRTKPTLDALAGLMEELYGDRGDLYTMPCGNREADRKMIERHAALNVVEEAKRVSQRAFQRLRTGGDRKVRDDFAANLANEKRTIMQLLAQYEEIVGCELGDVQASLRELDEAIEQIEAAAQ